MRIDSGRDGLIRLDGLIHLDTTDNTAAGTYADRSDCWGDDPAVEKLEALRGRHGFQGPSRREKQKPPLAKRVAKRRRRAALAKHHRKCIKLAAAGATTFPRRPPEPRG